MIHLDCGKVWMPRIKETMQHDMALVQSSYIVLVLQG